MSGRTEARCSQPASSSPTSRSTGRRFIIEQTVGQSLMLGTALSPVIGYNDAAEIAEKAFADGSALKEAALRSGKVDEKTFGEVVDPRKLVGHGVEGA